MVTTMVTTMVIHDFFIYWPEFCHIWWLCVWNEPNIIENLKKSSKKIYSWRKNVLVRFLPLVTTMVTKVDHGNHHSNDHGNHHGNHHSNHRGYYNGNSFFLQEYLYLFRWYFKVLNNIWFISHTIVIRYGKILVNKWRNHILPL